MEMVVAAVPICMFTPREGCFGSLFPFLFSAMTSVVNVGEAYLVHWRGMIWEATSRREEFVEIHIWTGLWGSATYGKITVVGPA